MKDTTDKKASIRNVEKECGSKTTKGGARSKLDSKSIDKEFPDKLEERKHLDSGPSSTPRSRLRQAVNETVSNNQADGQTSMSTFDSNRPVVAGEQDSYAHNVDNIQAWQQSNTLEVEDTLVSSHSLEDTSATLSTQAYSSYPIDSQSIDSGSIYPGAYHIGPDGHSTDGTYGHEEASSTASTAVPRAQLVADGYTQQEHISRLVEEQMQSMWSRMQAQHLEDLQQAIVVVEPEIIIDNYEEDETKLDIDPFTERNVNEAALLSATRQPTAILTPTPDEDIMMSPKKLHFSTLGLHGRDEEITKLNECWERIMTIGEPSNELDACQGKHKQVVFISGLSGCGKSMLASNLKLRVRRAKGMFVTGKFDYYLRDKPFSGIIAACGEICQELLAIKRKIGRRRFSQSVRDELFDQFGSGSSDIIHFFPNLKEVLSDDDDNNINDEDEDLGRGGDDIPSVSVDIKHKFMNAFRVFINVVCTIQPVVLVLDDLQFADSSSVEMLECVIHDHTNSDLMLVGIYRSNEVDDNHRLLAMISDIQEAESQALHRVDTTEVFLYDLDNSALNCILQEVLGVDDDDKTSSLAEVIYHKTNGNPFYVVHFLAMLEEKKLLEYSLGLMAWKWNLQEIEKHTMATDNVVDLLKFKMGNLPEAVSQVLQLAAFFGSTFDDEPLYMVWKALKTNGDIDAPRALFEESLLSCENSGFIMVVSEGYMDRDQRSKKHRWAHDKILEAALSLSELEEEKNALKREIGEALLAHLTLDELHSAIFVVANLLNDDYCSTQRMSDSQCIQLTRINLQAAEQAVQLSAFESASRYARQGISLMYHQDDRWNRYYSLCLKLYSLSAEVEACIGNTSNMESCCEQIFKHTSKVKSIQDRLRANYVLIDSIANRNETAKAHKLCLSVLKECRCYFPQNSFSVMSAIAANIAKVKLTMKSVEPHAIDNLPILKDQWVIEKMKLVDKLSTYSYMMKSKLLPLAIFRMLHWTLKYGICEYSPSAFAFTGLILSGILNDLQAGEKYAKFALLVLEKLGCKKISRTIFAVHCFVLHWTHTARSMLKPFIRGYEIGMQTGDTENAMWCIYAYINFGFRSGRPLDALSRDCRRYAAQMRELKRGQPLFNLCCSWQIFLNLMGKSEDIKTLTGEAMDEEAAAEEAKEFVFKQAFFRMSKFLLHGYLCDHEYCAKYALEHGDRLRKDTPSSPFLAPEAFHRGLSLLVMARKTNASIYRRAAMKPIAQIKNWFEQGNPNVKHYEALLDAELAALNGQHLLAEKFFDVAVVLAARDGYIQVATVACERYGRYLLEETSNKEAGEFQMKQAFKYCREWGAYGKLKMLQEEFPHLQH